MTRNGGKLTTTARQINYQRFHHVQLRFQDYRVMNSYLVRSVVRTLDCLMPFYSTELGSLTNKSEKSPLHLGNCRAKALALSFCLTPQGYSQFIHVLDFQLMAALELRTSMVTETKDSQVPIRFPEVLDAGELVLLDVEFLEDRQVYAVDSLDRLDLILEEMDPSEVGEPNAGDVREDGLVIVFI